MDGWMDELMDGWMDYMDELIEWMYGWMEVANLWN